MSAVNLLLLNTLTFVKEVALNGQETPILALSKIIREVDITREAYDKHRAQEESTPRNSGNTVELRTVGKHKWLFVNGVHVAQVVRSSLAMSRDSADTFTVEFAVDTIQGFDR